MAVAELLRSLDDEVLTIQTDSQYVRNVFTKWLSDWKRRGMKTSSRKPVENQDLILAIDALSQGRSITWEWVRGHDGHALNEAADELARFAAERAQSFGATGQLPSDIGNPPRLTNRDRSSQ